MKKRSSEFHAGARYERAAFVAFFKRVLKNQNLITSEKTVLEDMLIFAKERKDRYRKLEGGL